jgi:hypothetical protein
LLKRHSDPHIELLIVHPTLLEYDHSDPNSGSNKPMATNSSEQLARAAELIYDQQLKTELELRHRDEFVAIEPVSGDYFLGHTLSEAGNLARKAHPGRLTHIMRVGHQAAVHIGISLR